MNRKNYGMPQGIGILCIAVLVMMAVVSASAETEGLRIACFDIDVTPPIGSQLAYDEVVNTWDMGLRARGVVLVGADQPIVLCSIDWIGIGAEGNEQFRQGLAEAVGTDKEHVAVHTVHQHDAPGCDFTAEKILKEFGFVPSRYEGSFQREALERLAAAARAAMGDLVPVTHLGLGKAKVKEVASNRRVKGPDDKVGPMRASSCRDPELIAAPEGLIDPELALISFWNEEVPVAVLSYYACHPQSYYRTGIPNPDFPGLARFMRQLAVPQALHIHFNGAGGNVAAGKYNDGSKERRLVLAQRLAEGMKEAWENTERSVLKAADVGWNVIPVQLPVGEWLNAADLEKGIAEAESVGAAENLARKLAWVRRSNAGVPIDISCLTLGNARILHFPGEPFVEYQLYAKRTRSDLFVTMAAYGEYGCGYIGTKIAYDEGGYETEERASNVSPLVEEVLADTIEALLAK
ncbi:MAG: hypothetical protein ACOYI9_11715 [Candidatus Hydrogenedentales bacterium]